MSTSISVIIPTHNRLPYLEKCLSGLADQRDALERLEVIIVADGCSDGTEAALSDASYPFRIKVLVEPGSGAAAARNRGAEAANAPLLLFLDDDVIPSSGLVKAHIEAHEGNSRCVVIGPYPLPVPKSGDLLRELLYQYWQRKIERMALPGRPPDFEDVVTGNLSVGAETFAAVGGFCRDFKRLEDYEFGIRLLGNGVEYRFAQEAHALHLETTDLRRSLEMMRRVGSAEVMLANHHPQVTPRLRLSRKDPVYAWVAFHTPTFCDLFAMAGEGALATAQWLGMRRVWKAGYGRLRRYWYWRGVADELGSDEEWRRQFAPTGTSTRQSAECHGLVPRRNSRRST